jgi:hypothetical protein
MDDHLIIYFIFTIAARAKACGGISAVWLRREFGWRKLRRVKTSLFEVQLMNGREKATQRLD